MIDTPNTTTAIGLRDRALLEVLYATGIRHAEVHKLDIYDVDTAAHRLTEVKASAHRVTLDPMDSGSSQPESSVRIL